MASLPSMVLGCAVICASTSTAVGAAPAYLGAGACASPNCHGSAGPRADSKTVLQNEYVTWRRHDRHARAHAVLLEERSRAIGRRLGMAEEPSTVEKCVGCHTPGVPAGMGSPRPGDGVSCEVCHGPAGAWIAQHTQEGWEPQQSVALGMVETTDPATAASLCLGCHLGDAERTVDHAMIAAGHPALVFELDTFAANMPAHWKEHAGNVRWFRGGAWAAGQAVALREAARHLARQRAAEGWPDFARYDCFACHHKLERAGGWPLRGVGGEPPLDVSRWVGFQPLARLVVAGDGQPVADSVARFEQLTWESRPETIQPLAAAVAAHAGDVLARADRRALRADEMDALLRALAAPERVVPGFRTAQQLAWSIAALQDARVAVGRTRVPALEAAIDSLFDGLQSPARYDPGRFAETLAAIRGELR